MRNLTGKLTHSALAALVATWLGLIGLAVSSCTPEAAPRAQTSPNVSTPQPPEKPQATHYVVTATRRSYFARDRDGGLIPEEREGKQYFQVAEDEYSFQRTIYPEHTALIVMDPWEDSGSQFLNDHFTPVMREKLLPLVHKAIELGIAVFVLTNDPEKNTVAYGSAIDPELASLSAAGTITVLYHQNYTNQTFSQFLRDRTIDTLIYSGFASNVCVIGRDLGMIPMQANQFRMFFVPEASAAAEFKESWSTGLMHQATTTLISQSFAELIALDDFLSLGGR